MIQSDNKDFQNPEDDNLIGKNAQNANPDRNWDEKQHMSKNIEKDHPHNERRNLQADREKRAGSGGLDPDRNSGDR